MQKIHTTSSPSGYSIITSVLMIGFLLVLSSSTLNLVLTEMKDGKGRQDYLKAYYGAESAQEFALLNIKNIGYGYDDDGIFLDTELLGNDLKTPLISYEIESRVQSYNGTLGQGETQIIPLFWINESGISQSITSINFSTTGNITWNLIGKNSGTSGNTNFDDSTPKNEKGIVTGIDGVKNFEIKSDSIGDFLSSNPESYLILFNSQASSTSFSLTSGESFSLPVATISASGKLGKYTQNLETSVDNTEFLGILKYSIFSSN